jgi:magnesium chelatase family protein
MNICKHCGSVLPDDAKNFKHIDEIIKGENVKRAIEIALIGNHPIWLRGKDQAVLFSMAIRGLENVLEDKNNTTVYCTLPCPCGNFGSPIFSCECSVAKVNQWRKRKHTSSAMSNYRIFVDVPELTVYDLPYNGKNRCESKETIAARITRAREFLPNVKDEIDESSERLLRACYTQIPSTIVRQDTILSIAKSIAASATSASIKVAHVAEAIMYQMKENR